MTRTLAAPLLALGLLLTAGCSDGNQSGESNPDNFVEQESPGSEVEGPGDEATS